MATKTLSYSICPSLGCEEGNKVFLYLKDPTLLAANAGLDTPVYYLVEATITNIVQQNCSMSYYTFEYDDSVLVADTTLTKAHIDKVCCHDCNTQFIKEVIARNGLQ